MRWLSLRDTKNGEKNGCGGDLSLKMRDCCFCCSISKQTSAWIKSSIVMNGLLAKLSYKTRITHFVRLLLCNIISHKLLFIVSLVSSQYFSQ